MENCLMINGKQIELTKEQLQQIKWCNNCYVIKFTDEQLIAIKQSLCTGEIKLLDVPVKDTFKIGEYEFFVLEQLGDTTVVLLKDLLHNSEEFGSNNNYDGSNVDKLCNEFGTVIEKLVGADNLVEHTVDLTADDGLKCYGSIKRKMSLLTAEEYRKYVYVIDEHKLDKWWWLATAYSTAKHDDTTWIKCVSPGGGIDYYYYYYGNGVRPFCILKSNIFVSK